MTRKEEVSIIPIERVSERIFVIRGQKVILDQDIATLYRVPTKRLNEQVKRNRGRFPEDFMFQLTGEEFANLKSQFATSSWGGRRTPPYAFTEHGVSMLSSVLTSDTAVQINIAIMRTFARLRELLASDEEVRRTLRRHDKEIGQLTTLVTHLLEEPPDAKKGKLGFDVGQS